MVEDEGGMIAEFPMEFRGYARTAVDSFVQEVGLRLAELERQLDEKRELAASHELELSRARAALSAYGQKEAAIAGAVVAMEERRFTVEQTLAERKTKAEQEIDNILAGARAQADAILAEARAQAELVQSESRAACDGQRERLERMTAEYDEIVAAIRDDMLDFLARLPGRRQPAETLVLPEPLAMPAAA